MATVDLRTLYLREQHHGLAFNCLGRTGAVATDYLWICPECDDGKTHAPCHSEGGKGYVHIAESAGEYTDCVTHQLVAVDVIAVLEAWRQIGVHLLSDMPAHGLAIEHMVALGAAKETASA